MVMAHHWVESGRHIAHKRQSIGCDDHRISIESNQTIGLQIVQFGLVILDSLLDFVD